MPDMKQRKFTICYRHKLTGAIFCDQVEGRVWPEAANKAIENRINSKRARPYDMSDPQECYTMNLKKDAFSVMFAFSGHRRQLI